MTTTVTRCTTCHRSGHLPGTWDGHPYTTAGPQEDMAARRLPTREARRLAAEALAEVPEAVLAMVPMYQPGKTRGFWTVGQEVRTLPGIVLLATDTDQADVRAGVLPYKAAMMAAESIAHARMKAEHLTGTVAYAVIERDGHCAVFEGIL